MIHSCDRWFKTPCLLVLYYGKNHYMFMLPVQNYVKNTAVTEEWISSFALCWQVQERLRRLCSFFMEEGSSEREVQLFTVNMTVENPFQLSDVSCLELTKSELRAQWRRWEGTTCARWTLEINSGHSSQFYSRTNISSRFRSSKLKCWWTADNTLLRNATVNSTPCIKWWDTSEFNISVLSLSLEMMMIINSQ